MCQTDPQCAFPGGGAEYCGPVALSNTLIYWSRHGYDRLSPQGHSAAAQMSLVNKLAGEGYLHTSIKDGTHVTEFVTGAVKYIQECGYGVRAVHYAGWRESNAQLTTQSAHPRPAWLKKHLVRPGGVWLNIGWYQEQENGDLKRTGGHWITLAGFGADRDGEEDEDSFIIFDPGTASGMKKAAEYVNFEKLESGRLVGPYRGLPCDAAGYFEVTGELHHRAERQAILDGVVAIEFDPPPGSK